MDYNLASFVRLDSYRNLLDPGEARCVYESRRVLDENVSLCCRVEEVEEVVIKNSILSILIALY